MTRPRLDRIAKVVMVASFAVALYGQAQGRNTLVLWMWAMMVAGAGLYVWNGRER